FYFGLHGAVAACVLLAVAGLWSTLGLALRETHSSLPWGRLMRIALAAALAALCSWPATRLHPPLLALVVGGGVFVPAYLVALWLLRCLHEADAAYARAIVHRLSGGRLGNKRPSS
ncbi:MAG: hypothetical protein ABWY48_03200, partial [Pseudoxanthomonas sp.]